MWQPVPHRPHRKPRKSHGASGKRQETGLFKAPPLILESFGQCELIEGAVRCAGRCGNGGFEAAMSGKDGGLGGGGGEWLGTPRYFALAE